MLSSTLSFKVVANALMILLVFLFFVNFLAVVAPSEFGGTGGLATNVYCVSVSISRKTRRVE